MKLDMLFQDINQQAIRDLFNSMGGGGLLFLVDLGAPVVANATRIRASGPMSNGDYTIAGQPDVPRALFITVARQGTLDDTMGTVTIRGTDSRGNAIEEVISPGANTITQGTMAFRTVTRITQAGWAINDTADNLSVGVSTRLGLPFLVRSRNDVVGGHLNHVAQAALTTVGNPPSIARSLVDMSAGTYDGVRPAQVMVRLSA